MCQAESAITTYSKWWTPAVYSKNRLDPSVYSKKSSVVPIFLGIGRRRPFFYSQRYIPNVSNLLVMGVPPPRSTTFQEPRLSQGQTSVKGGALCSDIATSDGSFLILLKNANLPSGFLLILTQLLDFPYLRLLQDGGTTPTRMDYAGTHAISISIWGQRGSQPLTLLLRIICNEQNTF